VAAGQHLRPSLAHVHLSVLVRLLVVSCAHFVPYGSLHSWSVRLKVRCARRGDVSSACRSVMRATSTAVRIIGICLGVPEFRGWTRTAAEA
jgi:hypothetical protein